MSQRDYDPAFRDLLPMLPVTQDLSTVEKVRAAAQFATASRCSRRRPIATT